MLLLEAGRPLDAVVYFNRVLERAPGMYQARLGLGVAYQQSAQPERAAEAYRVVIDVGAARLARTRRRRLR